MSFLTYGFTFSSATVEPPTASQVRFNAPLAADTTVLWVSTRTADGVDVQTILLALAAGTAIYVQDKDDHTQFARFLQTGPPLDNGGYLAVPVLWQAGGAALSDTQAIVLLCVVADTVGPSVLVPNVVNLSVADATAQLHAANLDVGLTVTDAGPVPSGLVSYQAPASGLSVAPGTTVSLTVSSGPPPAPTTPPTNATPGDPTANVYETVEEFFAYCAARAHLPTPMPTADEAAALLIQATRLLDNTLVGPPDCVLAQLQGLKVVYAWTMLPATDLQALAWPRRNERSRNGTLLAETIVPQGVKDCISEIVLALKTTDLTATDDVAKQGITSVSAGSVATSFGKTAAGTTTSTGREPSDLRIRSQAIPDAAWLCLVPSWYQWNVEAQLSQTGANPQFDFAVT